MWANIFVIELLRAVFGARRVIVYSIGLSVGQLGVGQLPRGAPVTLLKTARGVGLRVGSEERRPPQLGGSGGGSPARAVINQTNPLTQPDKFHRADLLVCAAAVTLIVRRLTD